MKFISLLRTKNNRIELCLLHMLDVRCLCFYIDPFSIRLLSAENISHKIKKKMSVVEASSGKTVVNSLLVQCLFNLHLQYDTKLLILLNICK